MDGPAPDLEHAQTVEKAHGRIEIREIAVTRECVPCLNWPSVQQVCRIERSREIKGKISQEVVYAITSLPRHMAAPEALLALIRNHWAIENRLHWRRDVIMEEDASRIRSGTAPQAMALLRNTLIRLANPKTTPLRETREIFAEDRCGAIDSVKRGFL